MMESTHSDKKFDALFLNHNPYLLSFTLSFEKIATSRKSAIAKAMRLDIDILTETENIASYAVSVGAKRVDAGNHVKNNPATMISPIMPKEILI